MASNYKITRDEMRKRGGSDIDCLDVDKKKQYKKVWQQQLRRQVINGRIILKRYYLILGVFVYKVI